MEHNLMFQYIMQSTRSWFCLHFVITSALQCNLI